MIYLCLMYIGQSFPSHWAICSGLLVELTAKLAISVVIYNMRSWILPSTTSALGAGHAVL